LFHGGEVIAEDVGFEICAVFFFFLFGFLEEAGFLLLFSPGFGGSGRFIP
jgi:hypothetical protein